jgi:hypothetical protein
MRAIDDIQRAPGGQTILVPGSDENRAAVLADEIVVFLAVYCSSPKLPLKRPIIGERISLGLYKINRLFTVNERFKVGDVYLFKRLKEEGTVR